MNLLTTAKNWINNELLPEPSTQVRFITYQDILDGRKEKVKRLLNNMARERNLERFYRAKQVLSRIEQASFTIS